eukprot:3270950-Prymnesium_polylepis.1
MPPAPPWARTSHNNLLPDGPQHTLYVLAAAQAARHGALGAQRVHWDVAVAAVGTIALGVV